MKKQMMTVAISSVVAMSALGAVGISMTNDISPMTVSTYEEELAGPPDTDVIQKNGAFSNSVDVSIATELNDVKGIFATFTLVEKDGSTYNVDKISEISFEKPGDTSLTTISFDGVNSLDYPEDTAGTWTVTTKDISKEVFITNPYNDSDDFEMEFYVTFMGTIKVLDDGTPIDSPKSFVATQTITGSINGSSLSGMAITGIVFASLLVVGLIAGGSYYFYTTKKTKVSE